MGNGLCGLQVWLLSAVVDCNTPALVSVQLKAAFSGEFSGIWFTPQGLYCVSGSPAPSASLSACMPLYVDASTSAPASAVVVSARNEVIKKL
jgi:hypothetical protein